jgi:hypothetical protein
VDRRRAGPRDGPPEARRGGRGPAAGGAGGGHRAAGVRGRRRGAPVPAESPVTAPCAVPCKAVEVTVPMAELPAPVDRRTTGVPVVQAAPRPSAAVREAGSRSRASRVVTAGAVLLGVGIAGAAWLWIEPGRPPAAAASAPPPAVPAPPPAPSSAALAAGSSASARAVPPRPRRRGTGPVHEFVGGPAPGGPPAACGLAGACSPVAGSDRETGGSGAGGRAPDLRGYGAGRRRPSCGTTGISRREAAA